jgi:hypothetical protein
MSFRDDGAIESFFSCSVTNYALSKKKGETTPGIKQS